MECRPPGKYVAIEGDTTKEMRVTVRTNYADHPLVVGPRYQEKDFRCQWPLDLGLNTSGVFCKYFICKSQNIPHIFLLYS